MEETVVQPNLVAVVVLLALKILRGEQLAGEEVWALRLSEWHGARVGFE